MKTRWLMIPVLAAALCAGALAQVTPFTFAHITDTHMALSSSGKKFDANLKAAIEEMNAMQPMPAFIIHTGDITEMGEAAQFRLYRENIRGAKMPVKNTPGNHETRWADKSINEFTAQLGSPNISFKRSGVRFIGFNTSIWLEHHGAISGDTRRWIVSQLKLDPPGTPAVLFAHQPPMYPDAVYTTGDVELWEAIKPYNVRLFLNGHGHINKMWTVDGVLCKMAKGMMNDAGGYSLYEVDANEIRVYDKLNGQERTLVATIPIRMPKVAVEARYLGSTRMMPPTHRFEATVKPNGRTIARVEYLVDHHQRPDDRNWTRIEPSPSGTYPFTVPEPREPGRHTLAVRAVDSENGVWISVRDLAPVNIDTRGGANGRIAMKTMRWDAGTALQGPAAVDAKSVYVGGWDGVMYAVDRATMKPRWKVKSGGAVIGRPDVSATHVFFGSTDETIYAVNKATGKVAWKAKTGGPIQGHARFADGTVYVASGDRKLYALDAATGKPRWTHPMGLHAQSRPIVQNGTVYLGAWDGKFYALDARTGKPKWERALATSIFYAPAVSTPVLVNGKIILTRSVSPSDPTGPHVLCLDAATGETLWGHRLEAGSSAYASPTSDGKKVFLATLSGDLYALNLADGEPVWKSKMGEIAYDCSPVFSGGQVICNTLLGSVEGRDAETGEPLWSYKTGAGLSFAWPTVDGGTVYQPSMDGSLTAIEIPRTK